MVVYHKPQNKPMYEYNLAIRFQKIVEKYPQNPALWFSDENVYTYTHLNGIANRLGRLLHQNNITAGSVVCISGKKDLYTYAFILACLKVGAVYSVFDPDSPTERLQKIFSTCLPKLVVAEQDLLQKMSKVFADLAIIPIEQDSRKLLTSIEKNDDTNLAVTKTITGTNPSYIMYTSGSTGFPKGALMLHSNILNLVRWSQETYNITHDDILTNLNPLYFDNSVFDIYSALLNGACLVPFLKQETRNPKLLIEKIEASACTLWFSVPSLLIFLQTMKATNGKYLRSINQFIFGGEGYPKAKLKTLYDTYSDTSEFYNVSGPTECTCICSSYRITDDDFHDLQGFPPLGSIATNFSYLILGEEDKKVADGELGELCLLGPNVGRGYYNDSDRTSISFLQNPYNQKFQEIMYKTGDLVRLDPSDGKLYIHGRKDNQIKHMGYRIELEEIENALHCTECISEAIAIHSTGGGLSRIIAVVAVRKQVTDNQLRQELRKLIPDYMIPSAFYYEETLPKNPNGKVDRKRIKEKYLALDEERRTK